VSSSDWPFCWKAGSDAKPSSVRISRDRNRVFRTPCCRRSTTGGKLFRSDSAVMSYGTSPLDIPHQSVAQRMKLCSRASAAWESLKTWLPSPRSPWPYSEPRAGSPGLAAVGTMHQKGASATFPGRCLGGA
jgi:hypothetical protein